MINNKAIEGVRNSIDYTKNIVSYTQYSMYANCPLSWKLKYIDKLGDNIYNVHLCFGSAMHTVIQRYLQMMFDTTLQKLEDFDWNKLLMDEMKNEFTNAKKKSYKIEITKEDMYSFLEDGIKILTWFRKNRAKYYSKRGYDFEGSEIPVYIQLTDINENVWFLAFIDLMISDTTYKKFYLQDIKTSTKGWNKYQKKDKIKLAQLVLYKYFFSKLYRINIDDIEASYFILKRKIYEDTIYPQRRVQEFKPSSGSVTTNRVLKEFREFIEYCFNDDGSYNTEVEYKAICGSGEYNCTFCDFKDKHELCNPTKRTES